MRPKLAIWFLLAVVVLATVGCAPRATVAPTRQLSPLEKAKKFSTTMWLRYEAQFQDLKSMEALGLDRKLTEEQLKIYRAKRSLLIKARPLLEAFDAIVDDGGVPTQGQEDEILNFLNQAAAQVLSGFEPDNEQFAAVLAA